MITPTMLKNRMALIERKSRENSDFADESAVSRYQFRITEKLSRIVSSKSGYEIPLLIAN